MSKNFAAGIMKYVFSAVDWLSGEWLLHGRSNSGAVVFLRSLKVSMLIFLFSLFLVSALDPHRTSEASLSEFLKIVVDKFPWLGATFAAVYAAFYSRYASQWSYIAGLYNQIMSVKSTLNADQKRDPTFLHWQAGFIEDAVFLHLDRKPVFSIPIQEMLKDTDILAAFIESSPTEVVDKVLVRHAENQTESGIQARQDTEANAQIAT